MLTRVLEKISLVGQVRLICVGVMSVYFEVIFIFVFIVIVFPNLIYLPLHLSRLHECVTYLFKDCFMSQVCHMCVPSSSTVHSNILVVYMGQEQTTETVQA